jgi:hypothetical protein
MDVGTYDKCHSSISVTKTITVCQFWDNHVEVMMLQCNKPIPSFWLCDSTIEVIRLQSDTTSPSFWLLW